MCKLAVDIIEYFAKNMSLWNLIYVNTYRLRETGVGGGQEIVYSFAITIEHIKEALKRGMRIDDIPPKIAFKCNAYIDLFEKSVKFRTARRG